MIMKRLIRILAALALILPAAGCAAEAPSDANDPDEYSLIISGCVVDQENSNPLTGITVTLVSTLPVNPDAPMTSSTTTDQNGCYIIRKRFNAPAYALTHTLQFTDGSATYKPFEMEISVHKSSFSLSEHGYYIPTVNAALSRQ